MIQAGLTVETLINFAGRLDTITARAYVITLKADTIHAHS